MNNRNENQRSGNQLSNFKQTGNANNQPGQAIQQNAAFARPQRNNQDAVARKEGGYQKNFNRDNRENRENYQRSGYQFQNNGQRYQKRIKADETIDDIKLDIQRIEKEIELELKEIRSSRLGL